jgi:hypothetical protein
LPDAASRPIVAPNEENAMIDRKSAPAPDLTGAARRLAALSVLGLSALALSACGDPASAPGAPGGSAASSLEPIDAVPLPLDDNPLARPVVAAPVAKAEETAPETDEATAEAEAEASTADLNAAQPATGAALNGQPLPPRAETPRTPAPRIAVPPPREPARMTERPVPAAPPEKAPDRPVLNF